MRLLIGIVSCRKNADRRQACRTAWVRAVAKHPWIDVVFVVGSPEIMKPTLDGDTLYVPCQDDYGHLPSKILWLAYWASQQDFDYLFKCEDDTYVHVDRLAVLVRDEATHDYTGYEFDPGCAEGGAGYLLSFRSISWLAEIPDRANQTGPEDAAIAKWLATAGIGVLHDPKFWPWSHRVPTVWNEQITSHGMGVRELLPLHKSLVAAPNRLFRVVDGYAEYGAIGVNGFRGYRVDEKAVVELPKESEFFGNSLISAHASSWVELEANAALEVCGLLDAASGETLTVVDMIVDGRKIGGIAKPGEHSHSIIISPGRHRLESLARGPNARRYTVWALKSGNGAA